MDYGQRNPKWSNIFLGDSKYTLGQSGCFASVIGRILGITPDVVNKMLLDNGGFAKDSSGYRDLVSWNELSRIFPGITVNRFVPYNNAEVKRYLQEGKGVLVQVSGRPIGGDIHAVQYLGSQKLWDPWESRIRSTADFPDVQAYVVFHGKWNPDKKEALHIYEMPESTFVGLVTASTNYGELLKALALPETLKNEAESHKKVIAYIQALVVQEVDKARASMKEATLPKTAGKTESPTTQAKQDGSIWREDVFDVLRDIFGLLKKGNK